jgi:4-hydroxybenzoate polyprenyltransferase/phosphoserine phosphatase
MVEGAPVTDTEVSRMPLCVDLDGTLVKSDTLLDSLCILLRKRPGSLLQFPGWLAAGKARVKAEVAALAPLDAARLPYNQALLEFLYEQHRKGRTIFLATGADLSLAERVAKHLGIFSGVLASEGAENIVGHRKLAQLTARFGEFAYVGNARPDLPLLSHAGEAYLANPTAGLMSAIRAGGIGVVRTFEDRRATPKAILKAIRVHQWAKNVLLFLPLLLSHQISWRAVGVAAAAFLCFSFVASANYVVNDLLDIENDRRHKKKRFRPFAAGDLQVSTGMGLAVVLLGTSCALLPMLPLGFALWLLLYALTTTAYSLYLKRVPLVDVLVLSGLYTFRILAGAAATKTLISPWLATLSIFLFVSLAMVKRFSELENLRQQGATQSQGRGYHTGDLEQIRSFGTASAHIAVLVFCFYISRPDVDSLYHHSGRLWLIVPFMLFWLYRVWFLASRGELDEDPVIFALRDPVSLAVAACIGVLAVFSTM